MRRVRPFRAQRGFFALPAGLGIGKPGGAGGGSGSLVWNSADKDGSWVLSSGDRQAQNGSVANASVRSDIGCDSSNKKYWEIAANTLGNSTDCYVGIALSSTALNDFSNHHLWLPDGTEYETGGTAGGAPGTYAAGDLLMFAFDGTSGKYWVGKNGTWLHSGDPAAGTTPTFTMTTSGTYKAILRRNNNSGVNFIYTIAATLTYSPPSGFSAL